MSLIEIIFILSLCFVPGIDACPDDSVLLRAPVIPVALMRRQASSIVIARVESGAPHSLDGKIVYRLNVEKAIKGGGEGDLCVLGPAGVKVGSRYMVFIRNSNEAGKDEGGCIISGDMGSRIPYALEVIRLRKNSPDDGRAGGYRSPVYYLWINDERIFYPYLGQEVLFRNSNMKSGWQRDHGHVDLGLIASLDQAIDYAANRSGHGAIRYDAISGLYAVFEDIVKNGGWVARIHVVEAHAVRSRLNEDEDEDEDEDGRVFYKVRMVDGYGRDVAGDACIEGWGGVKVGAQYIAVIDDLKKNGFSGQGCESVWKFSGYIHGAFEVVDFHPGGKFGGGPSMEYVRLDDRRIVYSYFDDSIDLRVFRVGADGRSAPQGVAKLVSLEDFLRHVDHIRGGN